jgi:hypothetical protein
MSVRGPTVNHFVVRYYNTNTLSRCTYAHFPRRRESLTEISLE